MGRKLNFSRYKATGKFYYHDPYCDKKKMTALYKKMVHDNGPYFLFITLTFGKHDRYNMKCKATDDLIHYMNKKIYCHNYRERERTLSMNGFAFFENHITRSTDDPVHVHMLIKHDWKICGYTLIQLADIFYYAAGKVTYGADRQEVFSNKHLDISDAGDTRLRTDYCIKQIWDKNIDCVKPIDIGGLSDWL